MENNRLMTSRLAAALWLGSLLFLPWYMQNDGFFAFRWLGSPKAADAALWQLVAAPGPSQGASWLAPLLAGALILIVLELARARLSPAIVARAQIAVASLSGAYLLLQGFAIGLQGPTGVAGGLFDTAAKQFGFGVGAVCYMIATGVFLGDGLAGIGLFRSDRFNATVFVFIASSIVAFVLFPVARMFSSAFLDAGGSLQISSFLARIGNAKLWGLGCLSGSQCGVAWNTLVQGILTAVFTTAIGLTLALIVVRTNLPFRRHLRYLPVLPIITPPFVLGLALILLFGRSGLVNTLLESWFGIEPTRWIYGMKGVLLAQVLAFTPTSFLILIGVVEGVSPTMEEASNTLHASRWHTFRRVSLPLMMPGIASAFLVSFVESVADFGNPAVLGAGFGVLSTEIYFAVVGAQYDAGRAASYGLVLLFFALGAFALQRRILKGKSYVTVAGKGDSGIPAELPKRVRVWLYACGLPWMAFTVFLYVMAFSGGFVEIWGRDNSFTLRHYLDAFRIETTSHGLMFSGGAWDSFFNTIKFACMAAPITAAVGMLSAYLLERTKFAGQRSFEFLTLLCFATPGTIIGVAYLLAFNTPPWEMTGSAVVIVVCFVFRNMPVSVRSGIAAFSQLDKSLDEASMTLGGGGARTLGKVLLPLLKHAVIASLIYSFVRSVTTVSAVVFLVSGETEVATSWIIGRVIAGHYGVALAYCSVLIVLMLLAVTLINLIVGKRKLGRRGAAKA